MSRSGRYGRGGGRYVEPEFPKPFDFVPFADRVEKSVPVGHEKFATEEGFTGRLEYRLLAISHLHVSSGNYALSEDAGFKAGDVVRDHFRVLVDGESVPGIPGSSIKGAVRAVVEAVTRSCVAVTRVDRRKLPRDARACRPPNLCPACAIFGAMNRLSRVSFGDAHLVKGSTMLYRISPLYRPRPRDSRRTYETRQGKFKGRKFYFHGQLAMHDGHRVEVITAGSVLAGWIDFENLTAAELGLLFFALGFDGSFRPMIGGGKPLSMGSVAFGPASHSLSLMTRDGLQDYDAPETHFHGDSLTEFISERLADAEEELIVARQRDKLREILAPDNPRMAPTGTY